MTAHTPGPKMVVVTCLVLLFSFRNYNYDVHAWSVSSSKQANNFDRHHRHVVARSLQPNHMNDNEQPSTSRRQVFQKAIVSTISTVIGSGSVFGLGQPQSVSAMTSEATTALTVTTTATQQNQSGAPASSSSTQGLLSPSDVASLLHVVPTFCIVDEKGVPFFVVGEDAKLTSYFFTTYGEADRILRLAKTSSDEAIREAKADPSMSIEQKAEIGDNPWKKARISTVPLDTAVTLVSKSTKSLYFKVAPAESDVDEALRVTGENDLSEGKVPLFYYEDFVLPGTDQTPLYFRKSELEQAYRRSQKQQQQQQAQNSSKEITTPPPTVQVSELFAVCQEMIRPGGTDTDLRNLVFVAPAESSSKQQDCIRKGGKEPPFVIGQRIIVL